MIIYTNWFVPSRFGGVNYGPISFIRPRNRGDQGMVAHENTHQRQFWRSFGLMGIFYKLSKKRRYEYELEAYRNQLATKPEQDKEKLAVVYAGHLATLYGLDVTVDQALADIKK